MSSSPGSGSLSVKIPETSLWANRKCLIIACIVATANMQYGFDSAAVGALQAMPGFLRVFGYEDPSSRWGTGSITVQQLITSLLTLGDFISSLVAGVFGSFLGRRHALWATCILNFVALAIQIATTDKGVLYFGRLLLGFSNGFLVTFSNVYTVEIAPAHLRGVVVALFAYWVNIGSIWGTVVDNYTQTLLDKNSYRIPIACLYVVPTLLAIGLFFVPESLGGCCIAIGSRKLYIWAGSNFICAIFFYLFIPQMKGRSLEELDELFENRVTVRDFPTYHTKIRDEAVHYVQVNMGAFKEEKEREKEEKAPVMHVDGVRKALDERSTP